MYPRTQEKSRLHINTRVASSNGSPTFDPPPAAKGDLLIARYQGLAKKVHWVRFLLFGVAFGASVAVVGFSGSALHKYSEIGPQGDWMIPLWPKTVDLRPAHTILAFGITTTVFSLTYLVASFVPLQRKLHTLNLFSTAFSFLSTGLGLFCVIFSSILSSNYSTSTSTSSGSLLSWTCRWKGMESITPTHFTKICNEGSLAMDLSVLLVVLNLCIVSASAAGWWVEMMTRRSGLSAGGRMELV